MRLLILVLTVVAISALGGTLAFVNSQSIPIAPELQKLDPAVTLRVLKILTSLYTISAFLAAYGAWRRAHCALHAYAIFATLAAAFLLFFLSIAPVPKDAFFFVVGPIFFGLVGWGLWKGWLVLSAELKRLQRVA